MTAAAAVVGFLFGMCLPVLHETVSELVYPLLPVIGGLCITACSSLGFLVLAGAAILLPFNADVVLTMLVVGGGVGFVLAILCCQLKDLRVHVGMVSVV